VDGTTTQTARPAAADRRTIASGGFVQLDGESAYRIADLGRLAPFLISLASDTDLWMFITSNGGLTAGRRNADGNLFPYLTSDRLHDAHHHTGPLTVLRIERESQPPTLWEPFSPVSPAQPSRVRNLYKNTTGNRIVFEEIDAELELAFRYRWAGCDEFGWVRTATLENRGSTPVQIALLDGLRNVLPWGAPLGLYQTASNLVDAYKKSEVEPATGLGLFSLTAGITDRPEALEVLRANTVWCCGLPDFRVHLSLAAADALRRGRPLPNGGVLNGRRGNYLVSARLDLAPGEAARWHLVADVGRDHVQIAALRRALTGKADLPARLTGALADATARLRRIVASADGLQRSADHEATSHHFANVLFNAMRGGIFVANHDAPVADVIDFLRVRNRAAAERHAPRLAREARALPIAALRQAAVTSGDPDFARLCHEYLPLYFGRRHGDPSRPWNQFEIRVRDRNGHRVLHHEGNWRDIFQNWEALGLSFPRFLVNMVARFLNASTVDGFNPYRITREGVDWEVPAPNDPWSNIGYWGDHQIVYLLRLLEALDRYDPNALAALLDAEIFSYADVPYRLKPYAEILADPRATIDYDAARAEQIAARVTRIGNDGRLLADAGGGVYHANLLEKLLVPVLAKLSNLIPSAGIWMNTQRPEWNDANNALGGGSVSVVTLCHLRRHLAFLAERLCAAADRELPVASEVVAWFERLAEIFAQQGQALATGKRDARHRKQVMDALGEAFSAYRGGVYERGFSAREPLAVKQVVALFRSALKSIDASIAANRRADGLYHTYNQLAFADDGAAVSVTHLPEMLEGQVAVLSSGALAAEESLAILEQLFVSALYRPDQRSFLLYPERELPGFLAKNVVAEEAAAAIPLVRELLASGNETLLARDADGVVRFHGDIRSAADVARQLDVLATQGEWSKAVDRDRAAVLELFERVFGHRSYLGRSAAMYGYEGVGCVYWHMIAKLLVAVQETRLRAERDAKPVTRQGLSRMYFLIQSGIGYRKSVAEYGAFPTDPYSHTPPDGGARQPGMTGQVKEEVITRLGELGVGIEQGAIHFRPRLLRAEEFLTEPGELRTFDLHGRPRTIPLPSGSLAFTFCQVPVIYELTAAAPTIRIERSDGSTLERAGMTLEAEIAAALFDRRGGIDQIRVGVPPAMLSQD